MRKNLFFLILLIGLAACTSLIPATDLQSTPAETEEALEETAAETLTPAPQPTATGTDIPLTPTPSFTVTFTPYPMPAGLLTHEELEQRMQDWISGEIEFTDEDRLLDEKTGEVLKLGVLDTDIRSVTFVFYNLGFGLLEDQEGNPYLINLVGFEDGKANRFTAIFHNGKLDDGEAIIRLAQHRGRRINQGEKISFEQLLPEEFAKMCGDLPMSAYVGSTFTEGATGREAWYRYLGTAKNGATALRDNLLCEDCSAEDPPDILKPLINSIPEKYSEDIPYFFDYHVSIW